MSSLKNAAVALMCSWIRNQNASEVRLWLVAAIDAESSEAAAHGDETRALDLMHFARDLASVPSRRV